MENSNWVNYKIDIRELLKRFALEVLALSEKFPKTTRSYDTPFQIFFNISNCRLTCGALRFSNSINLCLPHTFN
ncbi:hypothetical protein SAMN05192553_10839 [Cyclobacterium xiamenense]|uniref:Uncharacterized protein n=1 Tax=Cyclobacterium xiamenense TaxID=1297121 RepID=A0A1H7AV41_9BACT|nr:hypothetical protein SAMN05192553_10839 [Cyclobacterium xiamenense]